MGVFHVIPLDDDIQHEPVACMCGPRAFTLGDSWFFDHHPLSNPEGEHWLGITPSWTLDGDDAEMVRLATAEKSDMVVPGDKTVPKVPFTCRTNWERRIVDWIIFRWRYRTPIRRELRQFRKEIKEL